jgi:hypothetical protein
MEKNLLTKLVAAGDKARMQAQFALGDILDPPTSAQDAIQSHSSGSMPSSSWKASSSSTQRQSEDAIQSHSSGSMPSSSWKASSSSTQRQSGDRYAVTQEVPDTQHWLAWSQAQRTHFEAQLISSAWRSSEEESHMRWWAHETNFPTPPANTPTTIVSYPHQRRHTPYQTAETRSAHPWNTNEWHANTAWRTQSGRPEQWHQNARGQWTQTTAASGSETEDRKGAGKGKTKHRRLHGPPRWTSTLAAPAALAGCALIPGANAYADAYMDAARGTTLYSAMAGITILMILFFMPRPAIEHGACAIARIISELGKAIVYIYDFYRDFDNYRESRTWEVIEKTYQTIGTQTNTLRPVVHPPTYQDDSKVYAHSKTPIWICKKAGTKYHTIGNCEGTINALNPPTMYTCCTFCAQRVHRVDASNLPPAAEKNETKPSGSKGPRRPDTDEHQWNYRKVYRGA